MTVLIDEESYDAEKHAELLLGMFGIEPEPEPEPDSRDIYIAMSASGESRSVPMRSLPRLPARRHLAYRGIIEEICRLVVSAREGFVRVSGGGEEFRSVWPAMGFDSRLPQGVIESLPSSLDYSRSVLDLHATAEGQRWWRERGCDVEYSLDLSSEAQVRVLKRFVENFVSVRSEYASGTDDGMLSPSDRMRIDLVWECVRDAGDLDDYDSAESRSADCGRDDGGRFSEGNTCQKGADRVASLARSKASHEELSAAIAQAIGTKRGFFSGPEKAESKPSEVMSALGLRIENGQDLDKYHKNSSEQVRESIAKTIAECHAAVEADNSLKDVPFKIQTASSMAKRFGTFEFAWIGVGGAYLPADDEVNILAGTMPPWMSQKDNYNAGYSSTPHPGHVLIHESVHQSHYSEILSKTGLQRPPPDASMSQKTEFFREAAKKVDESMIAAAKEDPEWFDRCVGKVARVSTYAATDSFEFVAEYTTAVKLGHAKNDPDLDRLCRAALAKVPRKAKR
jgi:hypothetical protein